VRNHMPRPWFQLIHRRHIELAAQFFPIPCQYPRRSGTEDSNMLYMYSCNRRWWCHGVAEELRLYNW